MQTVGVPTGPWTSEGRRSTWGGARFAVLGMPPRAADLAARGFPAPSPSARPGFVLLERHARSFIDGYNVALLAAGRDLEDHLAEAPQGRTGFWMEGAAMAAAVLDTMSLRPRRLDFLMTAPFWPHRYLIHVGVGWAWAALRVRRPATHRVLDPLLGWLAWDGVGFARGFFAPRRHLLQQSPPLRSRGYAARVADQGLGRCLWFYGGAQPGEVARLVRTFSPDRRSDVWSGVGLAATYAGGASADSLAPLIEGAGSWQADLAQGAVFGATARVAAGEVMPDTDAISRRLCGLSPTEAAAVADEARRGCSRGAADDYERWRKRIRDLVPLTAPSGPSQLVGDRLAIGRGVSVRRGTLPEPRGPSDHPTADPSS